MLLSVSTPFSFVCLWIKDEVMQLSVEIEVSSTSTDPGAPVEHWTWCQSPDTSPHRSDCRQICFHSLHPRSQTLLELSNELVWIGAWLLLVLKTVGWLKNMSAYFEVRTRCPCHYKSLVSISRSFWIRSSVKSGESGRPKCRPWTGTRRVHTRALICVVQTSVPNISALSE